MLANEHPEYQKEMHGEHPQSEMGETHGQHHQNHQKHQKHHHNHNHNHDPESTKAVLNRLSRSIGHLNSIKKMVEEGRDCTEVLIQLSAVRAAITNAGKVILNDHIKHCISHAVEEGDEEAINELNEAINQFIK